MVLKEKLVELLCKCAPQNTKAELCGEKITVSISQGNIADYLIAHGVTVQEWVPISEPPKERGCYLISTKHWLDGKPVTREAFWNGADWLSCYWKKGDRVELTPRVTHWMPLPQQPKGELIWNDYLEQKQFV